MLDASHPVCKAGFSFVLWSFFFNGSATTEIYTLSLHDALPIYPRSHRLARLSAAAGGPRRCSPADRKSTRLNSSHLGISYAVFCLKKKKKHRFYENFVLNRKE